MDDSKLIRVCRVEVRKPSENGDSLEMNDGETLYTCSVVFEWLVPAWC